MIHCDNQSCVKMNPVQHDKMKHVEMKYHYVREMVQRRAVELRYVPTNEQIADVLMKPLGQGKFVYFQDKLGVVENVSLVERECSCLQLHGDIPLRRETLGPQVTLSGIAVDSQR